MVIFKQMASLESVNLHLQLCASEEMGSSGGVFSGRLACGDHP